MSTTNRPSAANMPLIFGTLEQYKIDPSAVASVGVKLYPLQEAKPFTEVLVHAKCGSKIVYKDLCPYCELPLAGVAKGSLQARPRKQKVCNHATCNKSLQGKEITSFPYCAQEGCTCKLKAEEIEKRVSSGYDLENRLFSLSAEERMELESLRLSHDSDKRDAFKCMVVVGVILRGESIERQRTMNCRQVVGQTDADKRYVWDLISHMSESGERLHVHYALRHEQDLTGQFEHAGILEVSADGGALLLYDLVDGQELRTQIEPVPVDHMTSESRRTAIRQGFAALPIIKADSPSLNGTNFVRMLHARTQQMVEDGSVELPVFVDEDGALRSAAGRFFFKALSQAKRVVATIIPSLSEPTSGDSA